jgi:hypothetical protein
MIRGNKRNASIDISQILPFANMPEKLIAHLSLILLNNLMTPELRQIILSHLNQTFPQGEEGRKAKVKDAIKLIISSPEYLIQR